ncbi:nose resistant to fluoxetine protein 6-like [Dermacentor silvarum]|uniref:nose resistant to fluoxetine protein 6-like n=1 Tax=Dermacentor silvarum TaxID=543639 RepID=UPI002101603D|nr:nose resistant to fluoxetine protein 6-like [Dermacentor silvarum]
MAWYRSPNPTSEAVTLLLAFFDRILWSVFIVWITLACASGRGGFIGRFLSWNAFVPLSKLSFNVYLIHLPFIHLMMHASRERVLWSHFNLVTLWFAVLVWSFLLSYLVFLACEAPTTKLNSLVFSRIIGRRDARKQKQPDQSA